MTHKVTLERIDAVRVGIDSVEYVRYSATNWYERMGESDEPIYDDEKVAHLEDIFQESCRDQDFDLTPNG